MNKSKYKAKDKRNNLGLIEIYNIETNIVVKKFKSVTAAAKFVMFSK